MGELEELIVQMIRAQNISPTYTAVVSPGLRVRIVAALSSANTRRTALEICGVPVVSCPELDGFGEWLLVPPGCSVELAVARFLERKADELLRQTGRMHGLREAAMEIEP